MSNVLITGNASGTGTLTIAAPNTSTDRTLTIPDETGTLITNASTIVYPKGGPAFSAWQSSAQAALTGNSSTKLVFQSEEYDTASCFNNTASAVGGIPAYAFLPNVAGYYQINAAYRINGTSTGVVTVIYKNGAAHKQGTFVSTSTANPASVVSSLVYLNGSTDYVEIYGFTGTSLSPTAIQDLTYFNGCLLRAA